MKRNIKCMLQTEYQAEVVKYVENNQDKRILVILSTDPFNGDNPIDEDLQITIENELHEKGLKIPFIYIVGLFNGFYEEQKQYIERVSPYVDTVLFVGSFDFFEQVTRANLNVPKDIQVFTHSSLGYYTEVEQTPAYKQQKESKLKEAEEKQVARKQVEKIEGFKTPQDFEDSDKNLRHPSVKRDLVGILNTYEFWDEEDEFPVTAELVKVVSVALHLAIDAKRTRYQNHKVAGEYIKAWYLTGKLNIPLKQYQLLRKVF